MEPSRQSGQWRNSQGHLCQLLSKGKWPPKHSRSFYFGCRTWNYPDFLSRSLRPSAFLSTQCSGSVYNSVITIALQVSSRPPSARTKPSGFLEILSSQPNPRALSFGPGSQDLGHSQRGPHPGEVATEGHSAAQWVQGWTREREICTPPGQGGLTVSAGRAARKVLGLWTVTAAISSRKAVVSEIKSRHSGQDRNAQLGLREQDGWDIIAWLLPAQARPSLGTGSQDQQCRTSKHALGNWHNSARRRLGEKVTDGTLPIFSTSLWGSPPPGRPPRPPSPW